MRQKYSQTYPVLLIFLHIIWYFHFFDEISSDISLSVVNSFWVYEHSTAINSNTRKPEMGLSHINLSRELQGAQQEWTLNSFLLPFVAMLSLRPLNLGVHKWFGHRSLKSYSLNNGLWTACTFSWLKGWWINYQLWFFLLIVAIYYCSLFCTHMDSY